MFSDTMSTVGDRVLNVSLPKIGEKSLFTKDLEDALRNGSVDFVVHSLKDLPTSLPAGMAIGAVLERESPKDALVLNEKHKGKTLETLPNGSIIGTSSLRRAAQLQRNYPHLVVNDIRGNLNTRLAKLDAPNSKFSALILAQAGLVRMGWDDRIDGVLGQSELLYAVGQGALAVECRADNDYILEMLEKLTSYQSQCEILSERSFLKTLGGGCSAPVAVWTNLKRKHDNHFDIEITGAVWSLDGIEEIQETISCELGCLDKIYENEDFIPYKKAKFVDENEVAEKRRSPEVIDDSKVNAMKVGFDKRDLDIEAIISIHGELFKKCPYSVQHAQEKLTKDNNNTNNNNPPAACPLHIPVGQDFMGVCPYFNTAEKVELGENFPGASTAKCPITGASAGASKCPINGGEVGKNIQTDECPFSKKSTDGQDFSDKVSCPAQDVMKECPLAVGRRLSLAEVSSLASSVDKCPFLAGQIKMIDCDENKNFLEEVPPSEPSVEDSDLLCGILCHKTISRDILEKCTVLGQKLAGHLIKRGALDIMRVAQNEIHSKS